jgi:diaminopimelate epimerase
MARLVAPDTAYAPPERLRFMKMHGLGNDFVVLDARGGAAAVNPRLVRALADRHRGVGFDQLVVIAPDPEAAARLEFFNADGSRSGTCGNATRCVARYLMDRTGATALHLGTDGGLLACADAGGGLTRVNMGPPALDWPSIPLARALDTLHLPIPGDPAAVGMGNPHMVFFVADAEAVDLAAFGPAHETHELYPERTNVEIASPLAPDALRLRIWERGTGITLASGSCACAAAVAAARRGLTGRAVRVEVDGGTLQIDWREDGVWMTGPTAHVFDGMLTEAFLAAHARQEAA